MTRDQAEQEARKIADRHYSWRFEPEKYGHLVQEIVEALRAHREGRK